ncbi:MAG: hypothetical protein ACT4NX_02750 [Deltaproteobacteria bacterium]
MTEPDNTFDVYIRRLEDQELKGILLKLKNEIRKPDTPWEIIKPIFAAIVKRNQSALAEILPLIVK